MQLTQFCTDRFFQRICPNSVVSRTRENMNIIPTTDSLQPFWCKSSSLERTNISKTVLYLAYAICTCCSCHMWHQSVIPPQQWFLCSTKQNLHVQRFTLNHLIWLNDNLIFSHCMSSWNQQMKKSISSSHIYSRLNNCRIMHTLLQHWGINEKKWLSTVWFICKRGAAYMFQWSTARNSTALHCPNTSNNTQSKLSR